MNISHIQEVLDILDFGSINNLRILDGNHLYGRYSMLHASNEFALYSVDIRTEEISELIHLIANSFSKKYSIDCIFFQENTWKKEQVIIEDLEDLLSGLRNVYLFFRPISGSTSLIEFQELIAHLRSPEGCPWDRKQTHRTLRTNLIEETYEVLEAIDENNSDLLREELGDLLLQIMLHAQIASEDGRFTVYEVIHDIHKKITKRHPHIFSTANVDGVSDVMKNWEKIKDEERKNKNGGVRKSLLSSIPQALPSLSIAQKYQERAARVGFDWEEVTPIIKKIQEEIQEVNSAKSDDDLEGELGDLLFAVVNLVRWKGFSAESALRISNAKFRSRFEFIQNSISDQGKDLSEVSLSEMDALWDEAKKIELTKQAQTGQ